MQLASTVRPHISVSKPTIANKLIAVAVQLATVLRQSVANKSSSSSSSGTMLDGKSAGCVAHMKIINHIYDTLQKLCALQLKLN